MRFVVGCLFIDVCCFVLLAVCCCFLFVVRVVCCLLHVMYCCCLLTVVAGCLLFRVSCLLLFAVWNLGTVVSCLLFGVCR